ncbi:hypothetical protein T492DRAFT_836575 [Pavlovales sp. CCMP2436]|nr:hypothetical protein T492DRAFT_836575 [Pavlovales sp. CCMP2436]
MTEAGASDLFALLASRAHESEHQIASLGAQVLDQARTIELLRKQLQTASSELTASRGTADHLARTVAEMVPVVALTEMVRVETRSKPAPPPELDVSSLVASLRADDVVKVFENDVLSHVQAKAELRASLAEAKTQNATLKALIPMHAQSHFL